MGVLSNAWRTMVTYTRVKYESVKGAFRRIFNSSEQKENTLRRADSGTHSQISVGDLVHENLFQLGVSHFDQFQDLGRPDNIEKAIECFSRALELTPDGHPRLSDLHANLGASYGSRYRRFGEISDLHKTIESASRALAITPSGHPDLPNRHGNLGTTYTDRYRRLGEIADLEKSIEHRSRALTLTPEGHPDLPRRHAGLSVSYSDRYRRFGELADLERVIECHSRAIALTPDGDPDLPDRHAALGASYSDRYLRLGEIADLEKAIESHSRALALTPDGHPDLSDRYAGLGVSYTNRYRRLGGLADLEKAIECDSCALELTPDGHPDLPTRHSALGASYSDRHQRLGELTDLEKVIECHSSALALTPDGHPDLQDRHTNMGVSYADRYQRLGEIADLEKTIEHYSHALALTPDGHPDLPDRHGNLGTAYSDQYRRLSKIADLEKSIEHNLHALTLTPEGHPDLLGRHAALGVSYNDKYRHLGKLADLESAIKWQSSALTLTPDDHPGMPDRYSNLGLSYGDRYRHLGEPLDLEKAVEYHSRALELTPDGHQQLSFRHYNRATSCHEQYQRTNDPSHLDISLRSFRRASQLLNGPPRDVFKNALRWANLASKHSYLDCMEAFRSTIDLLPHFLWLGSKTTQRYYDISIAENLALKAASAAILSSEYALALEWLEHARCVVWNQSLTLRSPVDVLHASHPDLATQLQSISQQLHHVNSQPPSSQSAADTPERRHRLAREYNDLVAQVHKLPGFENFLLPTQTNELIKAARNGPIVVINCGEDRCDALLVMPGSSEIACIPLPGFTGAKAKRTRIEMDKSIRNRRSSERGIERRPLQEEELDFQNVLADLWYEIVKPVLDFLGYTHESGLEPKSMPHITWCPTGALSFLPLHAAGDYSRPQSRVFDHVISSYTPTLTALLSSSSSALYGTSRVLIVGQEATPGHQQLPGTKQELECIVRHMQGRVEYSQLLGNQATKTGNAHDPTESGFFLHDGTLELALINQRLLKNKGLAFLSACQTATGDEKLPDEAIHLASGMLITGYSSVIATMWSVYDEDAPMVADRVYAQLMKDGKIGNGEAGRALHGAVAELRDKVGEREFSHWVPYIHIGS
ncbi:TPR-like protein [Rhizoctonia solani]|uniref:TPR-like protein n=1 Tax=Rhizoctonia solani TaxID=456999 RepID=A0A8H7LP48_9AGAM|nr:TPR-like protein [Rhizoctonia solani]